MSQDPLVTALQRGEADAYKKLVTQYQDRVYNMALSMLQHEEDAADIAQEVFVQVFQSITAFKGASKLSTWIYRITITKTLEQMRRKRTKKRTGIVLSLTTHEYLPEQNNKGNFYHPGVALEQKELSAVLFKAIDQLPEKQRIAFILNKIEQLNYEEVRQVMEISLSSVESLLFRAKQNLQKMLESVYKNYES